jgi:hypothetical protein
MDEDYSKDPCLKKRDGYWEHVGWRNCLQFRPAERMHGVWYTGIEESGFVQNVGSAPLVRDIEENNPEFDTFLDMSSLRAEVMQLPGQPRRDHCTRAYRVEFIGRRAVTPVSSIVGDTQVIAADRLLSAKYLGRIRTIGGSYEEECAGPEKRNQ